MGPDSFLSDVHSLVDKFRADGACGAREVGIWTLRTGMSLSSLPSTSGQASGCPAPFTQSSEEGPRALHRGAPPSCHSLLCHFQWSCP